MTMRFSFAPVGWLSTIHWTVMRYVASRRSRRSRTAVAQVRSTHESSAIELRSTDCIFCRKDDGEVNKVIQENRTFYVRLDNFPAADGHVEIVPKRHVVSFFDLKPTEVWDAYEILVLVRAEIARMAGEPDGYTIGVNEGGAAGRTVDHLHIHVIPRHNGDVDDPRGGIRQVLPATLNPDEWAPRIREMESVGCA